jgi:hypothetical protein
MEIEGETANASEGRAGLAVSIDISSIVQEIASIKDARALPVGSVIGDRYGGLTFTDAIAAALESRSLGGWQELRAQNGEIWTIIVLNR